MTALTFPYTLTAGQPENVNQLSSNLSAIAAVINGALDTANLSSSAGIVAGQLAASAKPRIYVPINAKGTLPIGTAGNFTPQGGHCYAIFQSSGSTPTVGVIGVRLELDDVQVGTTDMRFSQANVNQALPFGVADLGTPTAAAHKIRITTATLATDVDSVHRVFVVEVPA